MFIYLVNELGFGVFFVAEHDSEKDHVLFTFFERKPAPKRGAFHSDHLHSGQGINLGNFEENTTLATDLSNLSFSSKIEKVSMAGGVFLKLKMKNGTHQIDKNDMDTTELEIEVTLESDDDRSGEPN